MHSTTLLSILILTLLILVYKQRQQNLDQRSAESKTLRTLERFQFAWFKRAVKSVANTVNNFFDALFEKPRDTIPPPLRTFLNKVGSSQITKILVCRSPVKSAIQKILDIVSFGKFQENKKKQGYDDLFHLYLIVTYWDAQSNVSREIKLEKNAVVEVNAVKGEDYASCYSKSIEVPSDLDLNDLINRGEALYRAKVKGTPREDTSFWTYTAEFCNCQSFVYSLLQGSGLMTPEIEDFVMQNADEILTDRYGIAKPFARAVTDLGGRFDVFLYGK